jgi:hypothetical protein
MPSTELLGFPGLSTWIKAETLTSQMTYLPRSDVVHRPDKVRLDSQPSIMIELWVTCNDEKKCSQSKGENYDGSDGTLPVDDFP